jgi:tol-pal system protein YbgF
MTRAVFMRWLPALIFPAAVWAAEGAPVQQATPTPPPAQPQPQPADLETRLGKLEALLQNHAAFNLLKEVETLKAEVSRLRGQTEVQAHQLESLSKRQSDLYVDLDKRVEDLNKQAKSAAQAAAAPAAPPAVAVAAIAAPAAASPAPPPAAAATQEDPLAESKSYEAALNQFKAGNYEKAIAGFAGFLKAYPDSTLASNAQYWTGYAYYARKDYKNALAQQMKLVSTYPQSAKVPDALLNIASNQVELNDLGSAKKNLAEIVAKYPGTNAAAIAAKRLDLLK